MTTQPAAPAETRNLHYVLTMQKPGYAVATISGAADFPRTYTRADAFKWATDQITARNPELTGATVLIFWSLEPNNLD